MKRSGRVALVSRVYETGWTVDVERKAKRVPVSSI
jgi:hypothetical protein